MMSPKITSEHLRRSAVVYVRQSSATQLRENLESRRLQYALVDTAREMGFANVETIDEDHAVELCPPGRPGGCGPLPGPGSASSEGADWTFPAQADSKAAGRARATRRPTMGPFMSFPLSTRDTGELPRGF